MKIKLIWDFYGDDAEQTAMHHEIHLKEFAEIDQLPYSETGVIQSKPGHFYAFITVEKEHMIPFRDALKPHRGLKA
ncbi:hypothetical protein N9L20_09430 [Flavobacteriaceae bacterium]|nr:hypothetical protein [Flavobacteriaceae bacterium]